MSEKHEETWILRPFNVAEALTLKEAATLAGKEARTVLNWCEAYALGRKIAGTWHVSKVALAMFLDGDERALAAYLAGDRSGERVVSYFARCGLQSQTQEISAKVAKLEV
jgi:hypothetical protein